MTSLFKGGHVIAARLCLSRPTPVEWSSCFKPCSDLMVLYLFCSLS